MKTTNQENTESVIEYMTRILIYTKLNNKLGQYDFTKELELVTKDMLNSLLKLNFKHLEAEQTNYPGIDLGDKKNKFAAQVTSQNTKEKINKTLIRYQQYNLDKKYAGLFIIIWDFEKLSYNIKSDINYTILYPVDFINLFKNLDTEKQTEFLSYLSKNFGILEQRFNKGILTNTTTIFPKNMGNLCKVLTANEYEVDSTLIKDLNLILNKFGTNLELLSFKERKLLYDCLILSKNIKDEYLLLTQGIGKRILENDMVDAFENLVEYDFIENDFEYDDGRKTGSYFIFYHDDASDDLDWLWTILKENFNKTELSLMIIGMDLRIFEA